jgi:hypothetical protein
MLILIVDEFKNWNVKDRNQNDKKYKHRENIAICAQKILSPQVGFSDIAKNQFQHIDKDPSDLNKNFKPLYCDLRSKLQNFHSDCLRRINEELDLL